MTQIPVPGSPTAARQHSAQSSPRADERVVAVIPARLASTRLPQKVLRLIAGTPMLGWVYRAALACPRLEQIVIASDSDQVTAYAESQGWPSVRTPTDLASGTDRVRAVAAGIDADIYVNLQADEPLLRPEHIDALLRPFTRPLTREIAQITTVSTPCPPDQIKNPNAVKVVTARDGRALYFSRSPIPHHRDGGWVAAKHLGLYAYRKAALERFAELIPTPLECAERLEQLRLLENGINIYVEETPFDTIGVDTEEDLAAAEKILSRHSQPGSSG